MSTREAFLVDPDGCGVMYDGILHILDVRTCEQNSDARVHSRHISILYAVFDSLV